MVKLKIEEKSKKTIDERLNELENVIEQMEDDELSLEKAFQLYEQGINQIKSCKQELDLVEKKMQQLTAKGDLEEF